MYYFVALQNAKVQSSPHPLQAENPVWNPDRTNSLLDLPCNCSKQTVWKDTLSWCTFIQYPTNAWKGSSVHTCIPLQ